MLMLIFLDKEKCFCSLHVAQTFKAKLLERMLNTQMRCFTCQGVCSPIHTVLRFIKLHKYTAMSGRAGEYIFFSFAVLKYLHVFSPPYNVTGP